MLFTLKRIDDLIRESVIVVEQTYCEHCVGHKMKPNGEEAKKRALLLITVGLTYGQKRWLDRHKDSDWVSRRIEYHLYLIKSNRY